MFSLDSTRGCRLAWSRLVDLGSIDPGSNPGSPILSFKSVLNLAVQFDLSSRRYCFQARVWKGPLAKKRLTKDFAAEL
jgi:hypothetical protein